ncbi:MAG: response regulator, partial [Chthoniobacterales bacterium]
MKILLVEDHAETRRNLSRLIEQRGHEVTACADVATAKAELARTWFPLLIVDWMLPGESGLDLCRELRTEPDGDEMFILLISGRTDPEDLREGLAAGANDYLTKPFQTQRLDVRLSVAERQVGQLQERHLARVALQQAAQRMTDILEKTSDGFY